MNSLPPNFKFNFDKYLSDFKELSLKGSRENSSVRLDGERTASDQSMARINNGINNGINPGSQIGGTNIAPHTGLPAELHTGQNGARLVTGAQ